VTLSEIEGRHALAEQLLQRPALRRLPNHTLSDLLISVSAAIDLAEGRQPGHAQRVAFIATATASALGLDVPLRLASCYAGLMHDIGVIGTRLGEFVHGDERLLFAALPLLSPEEAAIGTSDDPETVIDRLLQHPIHGGLFAVELGLPQEAVQGISSHHESWDGGGYPHGLSGREIPLVGRLVALADQIETMISQASPLQARRNLPLWLTSLAGIQADPEAVHVLRALASDDRFWLGLFSDNLAAELSAVCARFKEPKSARLPSFAESFSHLVDSRFSFTVGISGKVARYSDALGRALGLGDQHLRLLNLAAHLHDIGQLSVSERIMAKPGILTVDELDVLQLHPQLSSDIVGGISGLDEVALWIAAHHEWPDGKGYPDRLSGDEIPLESRILAVADTYVAMTSDRPYRRRLEPDDVVRRLRAAAGSQLDGRLVDLFIEKVIS
jgi:HD-GYP domain-containing protein (c-di-GMP phosphodiesterase class II)